MRNLIAITGTPGTGKTFLADKIIEKFKFKRIPKEIIEKCYVDYDKYLDVPIIDEYLFEKELDKFLEKNKDEVFVLDFHLAHFSPKDKILILFLMRADPKTIEIRLKQKNLRGINVYANVLAEEEEVIKEEIENERGIKDYIELWSDKKYYNLNEYLNFVYNIIKLKLENENLL